MAMASLSLISAALVTASPRGVCVFGLYRYSVLAEPELFV